MLWVQGGNRVSPGQPVGVGLGGGFRMLMGVGGKLKAEMPRQATPKPPQGLLVANRLRPTSHPHATLMRPSSHPGVFRGDQIGWTTGDKRGTVAPVTQLNRIARPAIKSLNYERDLPL